MSYILDALKKSDRERQREAPLMPLHEVPAFRSRPRSSRRPLIMGAVVAASLSIGAAGLWAFRSGEEAKKAAAAKTIAALPIPVVPAASGAAMTASDGGAVTVSPTASVSLASGASTQAEVADDSSGSMPAATEVPVSSTREGLLELWQLTEAEQVYLQRLDVSFHVHSNDPQKRAVIINGLRAREGQSLGEDLRLAEIVPDGIILEFQGQSVHLANPQPY